MAMKDVVRERYVSGSPLTASIREFPNEETLHGLHRVILHSKKQTWGSETSQYPQEKKIKIILKIAASEMGRAQTGASNSDGVVGLKRSLLGESKNN